MIHPTGRGWYQVAGKFVDGARTGNGQGGRGMPGGLNAVAFKMFANKLGRS